MAETITVTIRDGRTGREGGEAGPTGDGQGAILEEIERTAPVEMNDILTLSDGTDVQVIGIRQIFRGGTWDQVVHVGNVP